MVFQRSATAQHEVGGVGAMVEPGDVWWAVAGTSPQGKAFKIGLDTYPGNTFRQAVLAMCIIFFSYSSHLGSSCWLHWSWAGALWMAGLMLSGTVQRPLMGCLWKETRLLISRCHWRNAVTHLTVTTESGQTKKDSKTALQSPFPWDIKMVWKPAPHVQFRN